jgi:hypothetical protein
MENSKNKKMENADCDRIRAHIKHKVKSAFCECFEDALETGELYDYVIDQIIDEIRLAALDAETILDYETLFVGINSELFLGCLQDDVNQAFHGATGLARQEQSHCLKYFDFARRKGGSV